MKVSQLFVKRQFKCPTHYLLCFMLFGLLAACQKRAPETPNSNTAQQQLHSAQHQTARIDTARRDVDESLPLSRYGNPLRYRVSGEEYQVKRSSRGFAQKGIASWYGYPFHKERTSSGEVYDMYQMTAAHKTLPLPSIVKVKNLENGREVTVKVNDRGPFHDGRVIDLSYAAAKKLGMISKGIAKVMIKAIPSRVTESHWYLQAGSFSDASRAAKYQDFLRGFIRAPIYLIKKAQATIVQIGPFKDRVAIESAKANLKQHGIKDIFSLMQ